MRGFFCCMMCSRMSDRGHMLVGVALRLRAQPPHGDFLVRLEFHILGLGGAEA